MQEQRRSHVRKATGGAGGVDQNLSVNCLQLFKDSNANEVFIAVVGPAGAGAGTAADALKRLLEETERDGGSHFEVEIVKASDAIAGTACKVVFRPFVGVSPRLYQRAFLKDRDYKDKSTGDFAMGEPNWSARNTLFAKRYTELEGELGVE